MSVFTRKKKFHFVGIGGVGMSGLAEILINLGHKVSGSDRQSSELTDYLSGLGASCLGTLPECPMPGCLA